MISIKDNVPSSPVQVLDKIFQPILLPFLILAACTGTPQDDSTLPAPLFPEPKSFVANPEVGYEINPVTGDTIQPLLNSFGDTVITGVPISVRGKVIHTDSIARPISMTVDHSAITIKNAHPNQYKVTENLIYITADHTRLKTVKLGEGNRDFVLVNSKGDTISTGVPIPAKGKVVKAIHPQPTKALPPAFKDAAIADLQYLDVDQGMNASYVSSILEDKNGNLWIGTLGGGVSRYDGVSFSHFTKKEGLSDNRVLSILEDKNGNLWFGTDGGGVNCYDGASFTHFTDKEGLSNNSVYSMSEALNAPTGFGIWFGTYGGGVSYYDGASFIHYTEKEGLSDNRVMSILEDKNGNHWFGTNGGGVNFYEPPKDGQVGRFTHFTEKDGLSNNRVLSILEDKNVSTGIGIWFGTGGGGVSYFEMSKEGQIGRFTHLTENEGLSSNHVMSILEDKKSNLWFGTLGGGLSYYEPPKDGQPGSFTHFTENEGLSNNTVRTILEDKNGNLWFGTNGGGIGYYDGSSYAYFTEKDGFVENSVSSILEVKNDVTDTGIWFGTFAGGLSYYDGASYTHYTEKDGLTNNSVYAILEDKNKNLWLGTWRGGAIYYVPPKNGQVSRLTHFTEKEGLSHNTVLSILEDKNGNIWFGTLGGGLSYYEPPKDGRTGRFTHFTEKEGLSNNGVTSILEDKNGNIWFGTWGGGFSYYEPPKDGQPGSFTHFTEKEGLSDNSVGSVLEDKNGDLWFGTYSGGISHYQPSKDGQPGRFTHFTEKEGLSHNTVYSICEDKNLETGIGIWVSTEKGISQIIKSGKNNNADKLAALSVQGTADTKLFKENYKISVFIKQDGLKTLDFNINSALIDSRNRAWWGSGKSLTMLDLNKFQLSQISPAVQLKQLDINEQFIDFQNISDSLAGQIKYSDVDRFQNFPLNLELPYDKNHLTFHFAGIDWAAPHKIQYSYRMLGLSDQWSVPSKETKAEYRNLPYGSYTFQIRAIGESLEWSEPFEYTFTISPPWWHTWWAYTIYVIILGFLIWKIHLYQKNVTIKKEREKTRDRELQQAKEIEKAYTKLKSTQSQLIQSEKMASLGQLTAGIAHEIQNPLNFVNNFSEVNKELLIEMKDELALGNLDEAKSIANDVIDNQEKINHHGKRADAIVKGMLQHSRTSSGQKELTDINVLADEYLRLAYHGLRAKDKSFNANFATNFDTNLPRVNVIPQDIGRVLLNLIQNAFQAVSAKVLATQDRDYKPTVTLATKHLGDKIKISVSDNGPGIADDIKDKIFQPFFTTKPTGQGTGLGLSLSYDIVKAHGGELKVETTESVGSEFCIQLPIV